MENHAERNNPKKPCHPESAEFVARRKSRRIVAITILILGSLLAPVSVAASTPGNVTYFADDALINEWQWSGHQHMSGASAWGYGFAQVLYLKNDGYSMVSGVDEIFFNHASTFTVSRCAWGSLPTVPSTQTHYMNCKYRS